MAAIPCPAAVQRWAPQLAGRRLCAIPPASGPACSWRKPRYWRQRYFTCDEFYQPGGPIFFYLGNEADVLLYLNNTGEGMRAWAGQPWASGILGGRVAHCEVAHR